MSFSKCLHNAAQYRLVKRIACTFRHRKLNDWTCLYRSPDKVFSDNVSIQHSITIDRKAVAQTVIFPFIAIEIGIVWENDSNIPLRFKLNDMGKSFYSLSDPFTRSRLWTRWFLQDSLLFLSTILCSKDLGTPVSSSSFLSDLGLPDEQYNEVQTSSSLSWPWVREN